MNPNETARWWISQRKFYPIPIPYAEKAPVLAGWQELRIDASNVDEYFNSGPQNVGILVGVQIGDHTLCDIDLDVEEARWAWMEVGLETNCIWGRQSNPASHHLIFADQPVRTMQFDDPLPAAGQKARILELRGVGAGGKPGLQTVGPGSRHPSGEAIEFVKAGEPTLYSKAAAEAAARHAAAAVMLARHLPEGTRHAAFLALSGALARSGWHLEPAAQLVRAIYRVLWHEQADLHAAAKEVESTFDKYARGEDTTGLRTLHGFLAQPVYRKITQWLNLKEGPPAGPAPPVKPLPAVIFCTELKHRPIRMPEYLIENLVTAPGLYLITAPSKAGKTILSVQMAMSLANGLALFDNYKTIQTPTLLLEWDDPMGAASLKKMVEQARAARDPMPFYFIQPGDELDPLNFSDPPFLPYVEAQIRETGARFIILDSYTTLRGARLSGGDIVKTESRELLALARLAHRLNVTIILIHHESKSSAQLDWSERGAGSYAVGAAPEGLLRIARFSELPEGAPERLVSVRGRRLKGLEMVVRFQEQTLDYDLILDGPAARDYPDLKQLNRSFAGVSFTAKDVAHELGWARPTIYRLMNRLTLSGVLRKNSTAWTWDPGFHTRYL